MRLSDTSGVRSTWKSPTSKPVVRCESLNANQHRHRPHSAPVQRSTGFGRVGQDVADNSRLALIRDDLLLAVVVIHQTFVIQTE